MTLPARFSAPSAPWRIRRSICEPLGSYYVDTPTTVHGLHGDLASAILALRAFRRQFAREIRTDRRHGLPCQTSRVIRAADKGGPFYLRSAVPGSRQ